MAKDFLYKCKNKRASFLDFKFAFLRKDYGFRVDTKVVSEDELMISYTFENELQDALKIIQSLDSD